MHPIVVIGKDAWLADTLSTMCIEQPPVVGALTSRSGINACCALEPTCIVVEHEPPECDALTVVTTLRAQPTGVAATPIIVLLSAADAQVRAYREGVDVCLVQPVGAVEVLAQARALIAMAARLHARLSSSDLSAYAGGRPRAFAGLLERMPVTTVLTVIELEQRSGELVLGGSAESRRRLVLEVASGALIGGRLGGGVLGPTQAMREAIDWQGRRFEFEPGPPRPAPPDARSLAALVVAAMRNEIDGEASAPAPAQRRSTRPPPRRSTRPPPAPAGSSGASRPSGVDLRAAPVRTKASQRPPPRELEDDEVVEHDDSAASSR